MNIIDISLLFFIYNYITLNIIIIDNTTNPIYKLNVVTFIALKSNIGDDNDTKVFILNCSNGEFINIIDISFSFFFSYKKYTYISHNLYDFLISLSPYFLRYFYPPSPRTECGGANK